MGYGEYHIIRGNRWMKTPIDKIDKENRLWCIEIQKYYVFFYEVRNGRRIIGRY